MKRVLRRTKVVLRHLPPTISQSALIEHIDSRFAGRYRWFAFRQGKASQKHITYSRACIDFNKSDDVVEFAEYFNGHVFVNEKGTQYKMIVEYAPSQRVPKQGSSNDGREGTILKDPEYLEFLEFIAKPVDNLPSAEIQLERKEADRVGASKDIPIVTPLMDYVRQKRAARGGVRYMLKDSSKGDKDRSSFVLASKQDEKLPAKPANSVTVSGTDSLEKESGDPGAPHIGKQKILLLKGKEKEVLNVSGGSSLQRNAAPSNNSRSPAALKNQPHESSRKIMKSILVNRDSRPNQPESVSQSEQRYTNSSKDMDKKLPRPPNLLSAPEGKVASNDLQTARTEKQERRARNKDRPDRGIWAPLQRSDGSHASDESLSSAASRTSQVTDSAEELKLDVHNARGGEPKPIGSGHGSHYSVGNGSTRHGGRRGSVYIAKDADGSHQEGKFSRRGGSSGHGSHDRQVWVQKSTFGS